MIFVCEPTVKGPSHEKVNSGFLQTLIFAYPNQTIKFYAHPTHIRAMQNIARIDNLDFKNIEFTPVEFGNSEGFIQFFKYRLLIKRIFNDVLKNGGDSIFFFSYNAATHFHTKTLKENSRYRDLKMTTVLHASFESLANDKGPEFSLQPIPLIQPGFRERIRGKSPIFVALKILEKASGRLNVFKNIWPNIIERHLKESKLIFWKHSPSIRYLALSPHVVRNARRYIDVDRANVRSVILPTAFKNFARHVSSDFPRFAVFGYGNSTMLYNILLKLNEKKITKPYEIRVISMDNRGTQGFQNVVSVSNGRFLDRAEMESYAKDIDLFMILYDQSRYRLSCSNSILEALSYSKPILHFDNDCVNTFNDESLPMGYRLHSIEAFADKMVDIIENWPKYQVELGQLGDNIEKLRERYSLKNIAPELKKALEN